MKPLFHEDYVSDKLDPLATPLHEDFNWNELYERFGEQSDRQTQDDQREQIGEFIRKLFVWVVAVDLHKPNAQMLVGRRFIALAWVLNPALFEDSPSASKLAETLGITRKADLWKLTGEASQHFGVTNRGQSHAWNRGARKTDIPNGIANGSRMAEAMTEPKESFNRTMAEQVPKQT